MFATCIFHSSSIRRSAEQGMGRGRAAPSRPLLEVSGGGCGTGHRRALAALRAAAVAGEWREAGIGQQWVQAAGRSWPGEDREEGADRRCRQLPGSSGRATDGKKGPMAAVAAGSGRWMEVQRGMVWGGGVAGSGTSGQTYVGSFF
jgi:hypothetical protein